MLLPLIWYSIYRLFMGSSDMKLMTAPELDLSTYLKIEKVFFFNKNLNLFVSFGLANLDWVHSVRFVRFGCLVRVGSFGIRLR